MKILGLFLLFLVITAVANYSQNTEKNGSEIGGRVVDLRGRPLKKVKVQLQFDPQRAFETETDSDGQYNFRLSTYGEANLTVSEVGFKTYRSNLYLNPGQRTIFEVGLQVGYVTDSPRLIVRGVVRSGSSRLIEASVVARSVFNSEVFVFSRTSRNGIYELDIPSYGDYFVYATSPGKQSQVRLMTLKVEKTNVVEFNLAPLPVEK